jgi:hypothetical protein
MATLRVLLQRFTDDDVVFISSWPSGNDKRLAMRKMDRLCNAEPMTDCVAFVLCRREREPFTWRP